MKSLRWSQAELVRLKELNEQSLPYSKIAMILNLEFNGDRTTRAVQGKIKDATFDNSRLDSKLPKVKKRCLGCNNIFQTDSPRQIHVCDECKQSELYRGAA